MAVATRRPARAIAGVAAKSESALASVLVSNSPSASVLDSDLFGFIFPLMNFELTEKGRDIPGDPFVSSMRAQITHTSQTRMWSERCSQSFLGVSASSTLRHSAVQLHKSMHSTILESNPWGSECVRGPRGSTSPCTQRFWNPTPGGLYKSK